MIGSLRFRRLAVALAALLTLTILGPGSAGARPQADYVPGEILVQFAAGTSESEIAESHRQNGGQEKEVIPGIAVRVVRVPAGQELSRAAAYARHPRVRFAEPNVLYYASFTPNDPRVGQQWQYNNTGQTGGTLDADVDAFEAWDVTRGSSAVVIAVVDTGIDLSHEDLRAKIRRSANFSTSRTADDRYGHGTHVAGTAAAVTDNGVGVAGTCPNCALLNVKVLGDSGSGSSSAVANGVRWAADNGAQVINLSLGSSSPSSTLEAAVNYAVGKGVVVVAAAGNDGVSSPSYPAFYTGAIAVAASDHNDAKASFSNFGSWVDVAAPGVSILSTAPDHGNRIWGSGVRYGTLSGTSMASPHVAGVAGLIWASGRCASGDGACVRARLESRADAIAGTGTWWAKGRVNALAAVSP